MKKLFVVLSLVLASWSAGSYAADPLSCAAQPGRRFCGRLNQFSSLLVTCSGYGCDSLWTDQLRQIRNFLDEYYDTFIPGDLVEKDLGNLANKTSRALCGYRITGDASWVSTLVTQYNRFLKSLKDLQDAAALDAPYTCSFSVN